MVLSTTTFSRLAGLGIALALLLGACASPAATPESVRPAKPLTVSKPVLAPAAPVSASAPAAGILNLAGADPVTLDPAVTNDAASHRYVAQIYSGLVCLNESMQPMADIASTCDVSDDCKTYTFAIRDDAKFHDGRAVNAADFKYSWERACDPATNSSTAMTVFGDIAGARDRRDGKASEISGIKVLDQRTLRIELNKPVSYFLHKLSYCPALVVDKANVESGPDWWKSPNGTGPFKLERWEKGKSLILARNDRYYGEQAKVTQVSFHILAGWSMDLYEKGEIDVAGVDSGCIDKAEDKAGSLRGELLTGPLTSIDYVGFNMARAPFDDINVRRAFSLAVDREKLVSLAYRNMAKPAFGVLPPGMCSSVAEAGSLAFNVAEAKSALAKSKYAGSLPPATMTMGGLGGRTNLLEESLVQQWRQNLGIEVRVRQIEPDRFIYHVNEELDELYLMDWVADYPHPAALLDVLFGKGSAYNAGKYADPEFQRLLDEAALQGDWAASSKLYQQAEKVLMDSAGCLPIAFGEVHALVKPYVKGYALDVQGQVKLNRVSIAKQ